MRITKYNVELNNNLHNILVKENSCNYPQEKLQNPDEIAAMLNSVFRLNKQAYKKEKIKQIQKAVIALENGMTTIDETMRTISEI